MQHVQSLCCRLQQEAVCITAACKPHVLGAAALRC